MAGAAYIGYIGKLFWPVGLAVFYPRLPGSAGASTGLLGLLLVGLLTLGALRLAKRLPYLTFGWLWYVVTLLPVVGFVKIGDHALADRYTYLPLIGLFIALVWGGADLSRRFAAPARAAGGVALALVAACALLTNVQARTWNDSETLFRHALAVTDGNWIAHKNLGAALAQQGKLEEALFHVSESLRIWPEPREYVSQGWLRLQLGDLPGAVEACRRALALSPTEDKAYFVMGLAYVGMGHLGDAAVAYEALRSVNSRFAPQLRALMGPGTGLGSP